MHSVDPALASGMLGPLGPLGYDNLWSMTLENLGYWDVFFETMLDLLWFVRFCSHRVLVEILGPGPPAEHCRQDLKVDWIRLAKLGLSETMEDFEGYILFSFIFPGKIAIWGCTRARWNCSQLPFAGGDARARCSGPCVAQIPSGGETDLGGVIKLIKLIKHGEILCFHGGFQGGTMENSSN